MIRTRLADPPGDPVLVLEGDGGAPGDVRVTGARARVRAVIEPHGGGWRATVPLTVSRWGAPAAPLPSGEYVLAVDGLAVSDLADLPRTVVGSLAVAVVDGRVVASAPLDDAARSAAGRRDREREYARSSERVTNAVFFESFYGRNASCNPRALDAALARVAPEVTRYWSVADLSVTIPDGAVAVVEGSPEWWRARATSRLLIVNDWLRHRFTRRPGQRVLQTWHGTPLKRLALHRAGFDPRRVLAVLRESRRWDVLLAQNPYAAGVLAKAYGFFRKPVWVEGYPRNDSLRSADPAPVRAALGLDDGDHVILYAPTWRDDRESLVDFVDLERLASDTGAVVLVRGHSRTLLPGSDTVGERVIDVTTYPDIADLLLVADAVVTDYSSVMFDFTVTGRPLYFLVPDLEHYRGELRGFYFDLVERAPGPLVSTQEELTEAILDPGTAARFAERYDAWRARFNARDDGHAAERVVARIFDQGFLDRG
ncbi:MULTISPECIES: CDP-glycerol glycerophosphotransferase family protein [unclassified Microbacterium]|uniref:CDP-glycerol glycerophosphotransferase family protein n=1 Tax=unclassified Microbacterium TaxID=2609290 RepID=UPI00386B89B5